MEQQTPDPRIGLAEDRTDYARFRTQLALDRTTLAWIRTALTMATFGFGTVSFFRSLRSESSTPDSAVLHQAAIRFGVALVVLGVVATLLCAVSQWFALRRLRRRESPVVSQWPLSLVIAILVAALGIVALYTLLAR